MMETGTAASLFDLDTAVTLAHSSALDAARVERGPAVPNVGYEIIQRIERR